MNLHQINPVAVPLQDSVAVGRALALICDAYLPFYKTTKGVFLLMHKRMPKYGLTVRLSKDELDWLDQWVPAAKELTWDVSRADWKTFIQEFKRADRGRRFRGVPSRPNESDLFARHYKRYELHANVWNLMRRERGRGRLTSFDSLFQDTFSLDSLISKPDFVAFLESLRIQFIYKTPAVDFGDAPTRDLPPLEFEAIEPSRRSPKLSEEEMQLISYQNKVEQRSLKELATRYRYGSKQALHKALGGSGGIARRAAAHEATLRQQAPSAWNSTPTVS